MSAPDFAGWAAQVLRERAALVTVAEDLSHSHIMSYAEHRFPGITARVRMLLERCRKTDEAIS